MANHNPPVNGFDKRKTAINKKGRPKSFDKWRELLQDIAQEPAVGKDGLVLIQIPLVKDGKPIIDEATGKPVMVDHYATNAEMVARSWLKDPKRQQAFVENTFGKVPQALALQNPDGSNLVPERNDERFNRAIESLTKAIGAKLSDAPDGEKNPLGTTK